MTDAVGRRNGAGGNEGAEGGATPSRNRKRTPAKAKAKPKAKAARAAKAPGGSVPEAHAASARAPASTGTDAHPIRPPGPAEILGQVAWLMQKSDTHKHLFLADLEWLVHPPVMRRQFRVWRQGDTPVAYAAWARLTEEAEKRLLSGQRRLAPAEWDAGDRLWLIDVVAPFGRAETFMADLKEKVFPNIEIKTLVPGEGGKGVRAVKVESRAALPGGDDSGQGE